MKENPPSSPSCTVGAFESDCTALFNRGVATQEKPATLHLRHDRWGQWFCAVYLCDFCAGVGLLVALGDTLGVAVDR